MTPANLTLAIDSLTDQLNASRGRVLELNIALTKAHEQIERKNQYIDLMTETDDACNVISEILDQCELRGQLPSIEAIRAAVSGADFARCLTLLSPIA